MSNNCIASFDLPKEEIDALLSHFPQGLVILDTETTGLSPLIDEVIELASIKIDAAGAHLFQSLIRPTIEIPANVIAIHGITNAMVADAPPAAQVMAQWLEHIGDAPLMAHNARFDLGFISMASFKAKLTFSNRKVYCSCQLARKVFAQAPNHKLSTLAKLMEVPLENHHRAAADTIACTRMVARLLMPERLKNISSKQVLDSSFVTHSQELSPKTLAPLPQHLKGLGEFVAAQRPVEILYSGGSHKGSFRPIKPLGLLPMPGGQALYALCLLSQQHKHFSLSKIQQFRPYDSGDVDGL